ncbi:MAG: CaiB/BaiF CoA transferase family protein [Candidatus Velthaea sp.]
MNAEHARPLEGVTVVSLEQAIAAPYATRHLADLGARIIKVERPHGGDFARAYDGRVRGLSSHFVWVNRSKESLTLDLKHELARGVLERLLSKADVLVQNLAPGAAARLGLSADALRPKHPRLILCDISGYGYDGPYRDRKAYDLLVQCEAGFLSVTGTPETQVKAGISVADIAAGMYAYSGILSALIARGRTGVGSRVEVSMLEALAEWMGFPLYYAFAGADAPPRTGASHATVYPYGPFPTGDGATIMVGLQNEREWTIFCRDVLGTPELERDERFDTNARRSANREALHAIIIAEFASRTADEVAQRLDAAGIANARIRDMHGLWEHPQLRARDRWRPVETPAGAVPQLLPPASTDAYEARMDPIPALGQHTDAILAELGMNDAEIRALHAARAV